MEINEQEKTGGSSEERQTKPGQDRSNNSVYDQSFNSDEGASVGQQQPNIRSADTDPLDPEADDTGAGNGGAESHTSTPTPGLGAGTGGFSE